MTRRIVRDALTLAGLACFAAAAWLNPSMWLVYGGTAMIAAAVAWRRAELIQRRR